MTTRKIALALSIVLVALGLALKVQRYASQFEDRSAAALTQITAFLASEGWIATSNSGPRLPFTYMTFAKTGCAGNLIVVPLGSSRELVAEVQLALGTDVGLVEAAGVPAGPGGLSALFARERAGPGMLAVSPAPGPAPSPCGSPPVGQWQAA